VKSIELSSIQIDAGTQVRAAIGENVVAEYAERMGEGAEFPPVVLFHDGNHYYLADGFHRFMATQRLGLLEINADVRAGTKTDALWFALGANKANGHRMTAEDKSHAVRIALSEWPEKMQREIAEQVGCHPSLVSHEYQKMNASETVLTGRALKTQRQREAIRELVKDGTRAQEIAERVGVSRSRVSEICAELGFSQRPDLTRAAVQRRRDRMREMAAAGHTSRQMASELGISEEGCRATLKAEGIDVPADRVTGKLHRHDSTRIIEHIVMDAENLTADVNLIDIGDLNPVRLPEWLASLKSSRDKLGEFIRLLMKEIQKHEAA
jgi:ParB-like chromosome segregation protein Spo0J